MNTSQIAKLRRSFITGAGGATFIAALLFGLPARAAELETYAIEKSSKSATIGSPSVASLAVVGKNGWHVNAEAPITLTLVADPGVTLAKGKLTRVDLAETSQERARFDIAFTASTPGKKKIAADAKFVMCQEQACKPVKETVTMEIAVADKAPGLAAAGSAPAPGTAASDRKAVAAGAGSAKIKARPPTEPVGAPKPAEKSADKAGW